MIHGVILPSSRVESFKPVAYQIPFPLLPVADRPLLEHQARFFARNGVAAVTVICNHRGNLVAARSGTGAAWGVDLTCRYETAPFGSLPSLRKLRDTFGGDTLVLLEGDVVTDLDLDAMLAFHREVRADATVACTLRSQPGAGTVVALDGRSCVRAVRAHSSPAASQHLTDGGAWILEPELLDLLPDEGGYSVLEALWTASQRLRVTIGGFRAEGFHTRLTTWRAYHKLHTDILNGRCSAVALHGSTRRAGVVVGTSLQAAARAVIEGPAFVGDRCAVGSGAMVGPEAVIGSDVILEPGARVERSVVLGGTILRRGVVVRDAVVFGNLRIDVLRNRCAPLGEFPAGAAPPGVRQPGLAYRLMSRLLGMLLVTLLALPACVFLGVLAARGTRPLVSRVRRLGVDLAQLRRGVVRLRAFDLLYLGPLGRQGSGPGSPMDPPTLLPRRIARLGNLLNVAAGHIMLVGNRPMDPELAIALTGPREQVRFTCQTGFVSVVDAAEPRLLHEEDRAREEAEYARRRSLGTDADIFVRAVRRGLSGLLHSPARRD
jgi:NDP-sugar pyrophosphorylase family protein